MNANIEALAKKAGMEDYPGYGVPTLYGDAEIELFAEYLIKDCMDAIYYAAQKADQEQFAKNLIIQLTEHYMA